MTRGPIRSLDRPADLDLGRRWREVLAVSRRHAGLWAFLLASGMEREDIEQEILVRVLAKQQGRSRYNPERAGWGRYTFLVTRSALLHLVEQRNSLKAQREQLSGTILDGQRVEVDAALVALDEHGLEPWHRELSGDEVVTLSRVVTTDDEPREATADARNAAK